MYIHMYSPAGGYSGSGYAAADGSGGARGRGASGPTRLGQRPNLAFLCLRHNMI